MSNDPTESHIPQPNGNSPSDAAAAEEAMIERARIALESSPETIGPYRIIEKLGQGGMGEVYRAEQRVPIRRQVAIKLIKLGMDTKQVIARFEAERQALALMDHPHIAKVLDASTDDSGRPYFVMEYVKGVPIHEYADKNQLTIQERLGLFGQVCHAIQHAHHKGVIHRDIKPSNVLTYTQDGKPHAKIIDFGIAKAIAQQLTDQTFYTLHTQFLGTPQYMSPEQAEGNLDIDTRTDVYSLGVMLYELLTGTTPFSIAELRAGAVDQMRKIICETEPPKPSTRLTIETATLNAIAAARRVEPTRLGALVRGELDWIVMMALDKDRRRRYDTPNDLADDIEAFLQGERVQAAPPSRIYLMQKFVRKNKGAVAIASILGTSLGVGLAGTSWQWFRADRNAKVAELSSAEAKVARQRAEDALQQAEKEREIAIEQRDNAEFEAYVANLNFANGAVERGEYREAQEYLKRCPEQHRGWEWDFLNGMSNGVDALVCEGTEVFYEDPTGRFILKDPADGKLILYKSSALGQPLRLDSLIFSQRIGSAQLLASADGTAVAIQTTSNVSDEQSLCVVATDGALIAKRPIENIPDFELMAISTRGNLVAARSVDETINILNVRDSLKSFLSIPELETVVAIGFVALENPSSDGLVVLRQGSNHLYAFCGESIVESRLEHAQLSSFMQNQSQGMVVVRQSSSSLCRYLGIDSATSVSTSPNSHYCLTENHFGNLEVWSVLTRCKIASVPKCNTLQFTEDSCGVWGLDENGYLSMFELHGHSESSLHLTDEVFYNFKKSDRFLSSGIAIDSYGSRLWTLKGRLLGRSPGRQSNRYYIIGDRIVGVASSYNYNSVIVDANAFLMSVVSDESPNAELAALQEDGYGQASIELSYEPGRQISIGKLGLSVSDLKRRRFLTNIAIGWPQDGARSLFLSRDGKRTYAVSADNSWVCYDTRSREEHQAWSDLVYSHRMRGREIVDALWSSDTPFADLRKQLKDPMPMELREAALQVLGPRMHSLIDDANALFERERYQFVGRKEAMLSEISLYCSDSRICREGGPMVGLIKSWSGKPDGQDVRRFRDALLQNELESNLREHLAEVTQGYLAANPLEESRQLTAALGFLRCGDFKASKSLLQPLLDNGAFSKNIYNATISLCCASFLAMHAEDLGDSAKMFDEAEIARASAITNDKWYEPGKMFFEETRAKLEAFRKSSKDEK